MADEGLNNLTHRKKRKLRSLIQQEVEASKKSVGHQRIFKFASIATLLMAVLIGCFYIVNYNDVFKLFRRHYEKNYHSIIEKNENFCEEPLTGDLVNNFTNFVVGQDNVIKELRGLLETNKHFMAVGFSGAHGTGKTLLGNLLMQHWIWRDNVQKILWTFVFQQFRSLSLCGYNLIIIDDIPWNEENTQLVSNIKLHLEGLTKSESYKIFLVLIFNRVPTYREALEIPNLNVLEFNEMDDDLIRDCINLNAKILGFKINTEFIEEFLKDINHKETGCKNVLQKLKIHLDRND